MRIGLAQINSCLGDFSGNGGKILEWVHRAKARRCSLVVFPEASLFGYHPIDLLERASVVDAQISELKRLHRSLPPDIGVLLGAFVPSKKLRGKPYWNAAVFLEKGKPPRYFPKQLLPSYDVFDEARHIEPGLVGKNILRYKGNRILVTVCEDIWAWPQKGMPRSSTYAINPIKQLKKGSVDLVVNLSASPFSRQKEMRRKWVTKQTARHLQAPLVYVNMVGAQDEVIYDGMSMAVTAQGRVVAQAARFQEDLIICDFVRREYEVRPQPSEEQEIIRQALILGIRDFCSKSGMNRAVLGLSGGVDSALVAALATDALGPSRVMTVSLPGPFTSKESRKWAHELAKALGVQHIEIDIQPSYEQTLKALEAGIGHLEFGITHENLQARLRGLILMAIANQEQLLLLGTSNKSELAVGYSTLYGDLACGLLPIGDLVKSEVVELARYYNLQAEIIPEGIIHRPPSAELRPNQTDQDVLPPYAVLDDCVHKLVEGSAPARDEVSKWVLERLMKSEFKRWQAAPILRISSHAFGRGRRFPIAHRARV